MSDETYNPREEGSSSSPQHRRPRSRFVARPKFCQFCSDKNIKIDYKNTELLSRYVTEDGKIRPRRQTGTCAKHQRVVAGAVKRARHIALLPYTSAPWQDNLR
ncbi:MAG: 30S ribosomal protein S18 [Anaerolineaceae bacterium]|nr:30S ribosomal protein S18 [Anaerolineaceae bacterium]